MKNYKYILFDLDGTLIYSHMGIFNGFRYALKAMGKETPDDVYLRRCVGPSLMYSFQTFFGMDEETARVATAKYREIYAVQGVWENEPIEGVLEGLRKLKEVGYVLAMSTSKPLIFAEKIAKKHGFSQYFSAEVGSGIDGSLPTKASVIEETIKRLHASADECLMIGDTKYDAEGAAICGVDCALLKVGYAANEEEYRSHGVTYVFDGYEDLIAFLIEK